MAISDLRDAHNEEREHDRRRKALLRGAFAEHLREALCLGEPARKKGGLAQRWWANVAKRALMMLVRFLVTREGRKTLTWGNKPCARLCFAIFSKSAHQK